MSKNIDYEDANRINDGSAAKRALIAFVITLTVVSFVGVSALFLVKRIKDGKQENIQSLATQTSWWEEIPIEEVRQNDIVEEAADEMDEGAAAIEIPPEDADYTHVIENFSGDSITVGFAGDILFDTNYAVGNAFARRGNTAEGIVGTSLLNRMNSVDIMMINNEFPYSDRGTPREDKTFTFRAKPESARILNDMGVDIVGLANNHAYDYGEQALLDTFDALDSVSVAYVGAGHNIDEASHPVYYVTENGFKLAFICATQIERLSNPDTKEATATSAGVFRCLDDTALLDRVRQAKEKGAFVIVFIHWGTEGTNEIDYLQRDQSKEIAEAGADLIIGGHPHVLQKVDYIGDVPVVYSLGNYIFNSKTMDTCLVIATIGKDGSVSIQIVPAVQSECTVKEAFGAEGERILGELEGMSPGVTIDSNGNVIRK